MSTWLSFFKSFSQILIFMDCMTQPIPLAKINLLSLQLPGLVVDSSCHFFRTYFFLLQPFILMLYLKNVCNDFSSKQFSAELNYCSSLFKLFSFFIQLHDLWIMNTLESTVLKLNQCFSFVSVVYAKQVQYWQTMIGWPTYSSIFLSQHHQSVWFHQIIGIDYQHKHNSFSVCAPKSCTTLPSCIWEI